MSDVESAIANNASGDENNQNDKQSRGRKGKAAVKNETVAKGLGPEVPGDMDGRRRTRSATKGVTATPPPPAKKDRKGSNTSSSASAGKPKGRGRPRKSAAREEEDESEVDKDSSRNDSKDIKTNDLDEEMTDVSSADDNAKTACEKDKAKDERDDAACDKKATNDDDDDDTVTATVAGTDSGTDTDKATNITEDSSEAAETIDIDQKKNVQENGDKSKSPAAAAKAKTSTEGGSVKDDDIDVEGEKKKATADKMVDEISKMKQATANNTTVTTNAVMADQNSATDKSTE